MTNGTEKSDTKPFWCVAANIVQERFYGPSGTLSSRGTKHFKPGAKVYVVSFYLGGSETLVVVGRHRGSHRYVTMALPTECLANPRAELVYSPHIIREIIAFRNTHDGKRKQPDESDTEWGGGEEDKELAEARSVQLQKTIEWIQNKILLKRAEAMEANETEAQ